MAMPIIAPGSIKRSKRLSQCFRYAQTLTQSMTINIGRRIPAALTGEILNDRIGTAKSAKPPNPPLEIPVMMTAKTALIRNMGSDNISGFMPCAEADRNPL